MQIKPAKPSTNGYKKAPPHFSGASVAQPVDNNRTTFLPDAPVRTIAAGGYASRRFLLGGAPLSKYATAALLLLALIWLTGLLPGRWFGVAAFSTLMIVHIAYGRALARRDYVRFTSTPAPEIVPSQIDTADSLPVYVTGGLSVEGREQRFTYVPGFYKTFATREHALLCQVRHRRFLRILQWPVDEVGMWYAFFQPESIRRVAWGSLNFIPDQMPSVAIEYNVLKPANKGFRRNSAEQRTVETIYLSSTDKQDLRRILADLRADESVKSDRTPQRESS